MSSRVFRSTSVATLSTAMAIVTLADPLAAQRAMPAPARLEAPAPKLVVMITVDQLLPEYFERYGAQFTGGLARLTREGAVFTRAYQDHAITETAPGHASTLSGRFPASTGITLNAAGVGDSQAPLIGADGAGASPYRFRGSTLTDWLRVKDPRSRALSVSRKDRGAILPLGRAKQEAYWYALNGKFTTSTYYRDTLPDWVRRFNDRKTPTSYAGRSWSLLLPAAEYAETDSVPVESAGRDFVFPHVLPADPAQAARMFPEFPWMDEATVDIALEGLNQLQLGLGPHTDVLAVSLSVTDAVGHRYGPDSREIHDQILRLDRTLGRLLDSLFVLRPATTIAIALTADHGVAPFPELAALHGRPPATHVDMGGAVTRVRQALHARGVDSTAFRVQEGMVTVNRSEFARAKLSIDSTVNAFLAVMRRTPGVLRADRMNVLRARRNDRDVVARRWLNMIPAEFDVIAVVTLRPYAVEGHPNYAQHGTPHEYDAHVPLIFHGSWFKTGTYTTMARVVDIAPTLAWITNTAPTERLDGRILRAALK